MQINKKIYTTLIIAVLTMSAIMTAIPMASAEITNAPTLNPTSGNTGTKVTVSSAAGGASPFATVTAYLDALSGAVLGSGSATSTGAYSFQVTVPATTAGEHFIVVNDGETESNGTLFTVTPKITIDVTRALPGDSVSVSGTGFNSTKAVTLILNSTTLGTANTVTLSTSPTTDAVGSFSTTIVIPAMNTSVYDIYTLIANDTTGNNANTTLTIDYYIILTPSVGPTGITTTITGRIVANTAYSLTFNDAPIATGTSSTDGSYSFAYTIPTVLGTGSYPVRVIWATVNNRTATFNVTASPTIVVGPPTSGFAGAIIDLSGSGFSGQANVTLYFGSTVVNSSAGGFGPTTNGGALPTGTTFVVPALAPGIYAVSVVDQYGATSAAGAYFTITSTPVTQVNINANEYYPMDIISFSIYTTDNFTSGPTVTVRDPSGMTVWMGAWTLSATGVSTWRMLYMNEMINGNYMQLAADCPLGTWNWTITYTAAVAGAKTATGLFNVVEMPSMQTVLDRLDEMEATITDVITTTENDIIAVVNTKTGTIMTDISSLDAQLTSIDGGIATISTSIGDIQTTLAGLSMDALGADITTIKNGVATIQTSLGTVSTAVSNLDAKLTNVQGDVATVLTNMGTLDGKVTSIDGKVATVETDVGTIQADVSDVKASSDQTPVWIAVVLSLVAAIAAIFAVITIRQKIAG